jgi:hemoglobin
MIEEAPMTKPVPTLFEWLGGMPALSAMVKLFYERIPADPLLAPLFAHAAPEHAEHVTRFVAEVLGGPKAYSAELGGHPAMLRKHVGRALTEAQRQRWMQLLLQCADEVGAPSDPEFRSAFVAYLEWGTRLAVINSQPGADVSGAAAMPSWGWGEAKGPFIPE